MSTQKIWDIHLKYNGEVTPEFIAGMQQLAESIAQESGVVWKIWTHEANTNHFGSTYLFTDQQALETYRAMHIKRLNDIGITDISEHVFDIMEELSHITHAPIAK